MSTRGISEKGRSGGDEVKVESEGRIYFATAHCAASHRLLMNRVRCFGGKMSSGTYDHPYECSLTYKVHGGSSRATGPSAHHIYGDHRN